MIWSWCFIWGWASSRITLLQMIVWNLYFLIVGAYWINFSTWRLSISFEKLANICKDVLTIHGTSLPCTFVNFVNSPLLEENLAFITLIDPMVLILISQPSSFMAMRNPSWLSSSMKRFNGGVLCGGKKISFSSATCFTVVLCFFKPIFLGHRASMADLTVAANFKWARQ